MMKNLLPSLALAVSLAAAGLAASPAAAQEDRPSGSALDGDYLVVGIGGAYVPSYEGSDNYKLSPAAAVAGRIGGVGISPRVGGIALDFISDSRDQKVNFQLGPVARVRFDRTGRIKDPVVRRLGERDHAVEVGANAGISFNKLTNPYDSLTFSADVRWDVAGAHDGMVIAPAVSYLTPLSKGILTALTVSAERVDGDYADYYYSIPAVNAGPLPGYDAHSGWKNVGALLMVAVDLDGDLTNGGLSIVAGGGYSSLLGNFKRSPIVADRGDADQWTGALGIAYTF